MDAVRLGVLFVSSQRNLPERYFSKPSLFLDMNLLLLLAPVAVLCTIYGVIRRGRFLFLFGYFLYGIVVVSNELLLFSETENPMRVANVLIWGTQIILAFPNPLRYDGSKAFKTFSYKTFLVFTLINCYGIYISASIPNLEPIIQRIAQVYHGVLAFLPLVAIVLISKNKIPTSNHQ